MILKKIIFEENSYYSLQNFSSYDLIWIIEKDYLLLKKYLEEIYQHLPQNIPKMALITHNGKEHSQKSHFKKYSLFDMIDLKDIKDP